MTGQPPALVGALPADHLVTTSTDLALALGGDITSFTGELLRLIAKADPENRERLRLAFPKVVRSWELWMENAELTAGQLQQLVDEDTITAAFLGFGDGMESLIALKKALANG